MHNIIFAYLYLSYAFLATNSKCASSLYKFYFYCPNSSVAGPIDWPKKPLEKLRCIHIIIYYMKTHHIIVQPCRCLSWADVDDLYRVRQTANNTNIPKKKKIMENSWQYTYYYYYIYTYRLGWKKLYYISLYCTERSIFHVV